MEAVLGNILETTIEAGLAKQFAVSSVVRELWYSPGDISRLGETALLPSHLRETCRPSMLVNGVLTIECLSPSFMFDLRWDSKDILARLRARVGNKVRKLNLVLEGHL